MLYDVITQQKNERDKLLTADYIPRNEKVNIESGLINVIIGPRRAGKSFFGHHSLKNRNYGYVNFDDERLLQFNNFDEILSAVNAVYNNPEILFFDEIQNKPNWELFVNRLHRIGKKVVLTGSNSNLLSGEFSTHLTGRNYIINIFPLSFNELINISESKGELVQKELLNTLLEFGGYPEVITKSIEPKEYLKMLFRDTIYKDLVLRYKPRDPVMIHKIASMLVSNTGCETSIRNLSALVKYNNRTVSKFLSYLLNTMIFFQIPKFSYKVKEQLSSNKKSYVIDNGFINSVGYSASPNEGKKFENFTAIELFRRTISQGKRLFYWKKEYEVDFVIQKGETVEKLIQVCVDIENPKTISREKRALLEASKLLRCNNLTIITKNYSAIDSFEWYGLTREIRFVRIIDWLSGKV